MKLFDENYSIYVSLILFKDDTKVIEALPFHQFITHLSRLYMCVNYY
jgi:hypothetical protein